MYGNWPSTAPKAGHVTDLGLTLSAPPHAYCVPIWVYDTLPGRPSGILCPMRLFRRRLGLQPSGVP